MTATTITTNDLLNAWQGLSMDDATGRAASLDGQLRELEAFRTQLEAGITAQIITMRGTNGEGRVYSWAEIGAALGMTRQAAQQRYGKTV